MLLGCEVYPLHYRGATRHPLLRMSQTCHCPFACLDKLSLSSGYCPNIIKIYFSTEVE
jgi:hypothetical protein